MSAAPFALPPRRRAGRVVALLAQAAAEVRRLNAFGDADDLAGPDDIERMRRFVDESEAWMSLRPRTGETPRDSSPAPSLADASALSPTRRP